MRTDENGNPCPETLGEYRTYCATLAPSSEAVAFLDRLIKNDPDGADSVVVVPDSQMRNLLLPKMRQFPSGEEIDAQVKTLAVQGHFFNNTCQLARGFVAAGLDVQLQTMTNSAGQFNVIFSIYNKTGDVRDYMRVLEDNGDFYYIEDDHLLPFTDMDAWLAHIIDFVGLTGDEPIGITE